MATPLKRNESIAPLSREHHLGLLFCWKIRQGLKREVDIERIRQYVNFFWASHLQQHFALEEALLFSQVEDAHCNKGFEDHAEIKNLVYAIIGIRGSDPAAYTLLATLTETHIRFEERILFPFLELALPVATLAEIGVVLQGSDVNVPETYADQFWITA